MSLPIEWKRRLDRWRKELPRHFYQPLGPVDLSGFTTFDQLTPEQALQQGNFEPFVPGMPWGAKWEYAWFKGELTLPPAAAGARIVLKVEVGAESAVYINGLIAGARDHEHQEITLTRNGRPGERYEVLIEGYGGHGPMVEGGGPVPPERPSVPEPGPTQRTFGETTFGIWHEDAYQLWVDVETLVRLRDALDPESLRAVEIDAALRDFTTIVDFELPLAERLATMRAGRERLQPLLACVNGSTAPTFYAIGHGHLDVAWLWPLQETERKMARTTANQIALMQEYPDYKFIQSQPHLLTMLRARQPELYERVRKAVAAGQIVLEGGMWVEADTNLSGGEALIRQFVHGKRFFREEFGVESELLWLPDVFGYSGAMPQIMRGCGVKYFGTAKIYWAYNGGEPFPYSTFNWQGIDGSTVIAHLFRGYGNATDPATVIGLWHDKVHKEGLSTDLLVFGHGDGGGGPTRDHLEFLRRQRDLEGAPRVRLASPIEFYHDLEARGVQLPTYVGELYFQAHRGTYTSQAHTKKNNRQSELALREAEFWGAAARALAGYSYPRPAIDGAWRTLLLHQFHDILPGSSIHRVYEEADMAHAAVQQTAHETAQAALAALVGRTPAGRERQLPTGLADLTVCNSLSWPRTALVALPQGFLGAADAQGRPLPVQAVDGQLWAEVTVPGCGWMTVRPAEAPQSPANSLRAATNLLENEHLRLELNRRGEIVSLYDKDAGRELAAGLCNSFHLYKDVPGWFDAWDLDSNYKLMPVELPEEAQIEVVSSGPLVAALRVTRKLHHSALTQEISLRRGSRRVDFATAIDWQESHKVLKVNFPVDIHTSEALHEIQFGHIRRPNHASRLLDEDRFEVANHKWSALTEENRGFAVLNDCKYGVNVEGNSINLTLLKSALAPDMTADKGLQTFTYALYAWNGPFVEGGVVRAAYDLNCPVLTTPGVGAMPEGSLFQVDAANVIIETVKPAEDGSTDVVVRLYEALRASARCTLSTALPIASAAETNMLEEIQRELTVSGQSMVLDFRPFEIKTIRLRIK